MSMITKSMILKSLKGVMDPELGWSVVDLGLIYETKINGGNVHIKMTLTTPMCPLASMIVDDVKGNISRLKGVRNVEVELVWDPPWSPKRLSPQAKKTLGL
jgi:metal-sulfur cluster biosynthetic enzyme